MPSNIVDKETISDGAKLARLLQYCTGPARKLIQCCTVKEPSGGYHLARQLLQSQFGNAFDISDAWITKIVGRPAITDNKGPGKSDTEMARKAPYAKLSTGQQRNQPTVPNGGNPKTKENPKGKPVKHGKNHLKRTRKGKTNPKAHLIGENKEKI